MAASLPPLPSTLKSLQHYLKTAQEHDKRDPVVAYYCRLYAFQKGMELDKKSTEGRAFLMGLMDLMEQGKQQLNDSEAISSEVVGHAHVENYALKLFLYADNEDRAARFGKNVVKSFYTAGMIMDVLTQFGELPEDLEKNRKYAKWKAAYLHNCLKSGETPHAGPLDEEEGEFSEQAEGGFPQPGTSQPPPSQPSQYIPPNQPPPSQHNPYNQPPPSQPNPYIPPANPTPYVPPAQSYQAPVAPAAAPSAPSGQRREAPAVAAGVTLNPQEYQRAMKLCKFASSALQYQDSKTAIDNLTKALNLLSTGRE